MRFTSVVLYTKKYLFMGLVTNQSKPGPKKQDNFSFPRISSLNRLCHPLSRKTLRFPGNNKNKENALDQICELFNNSFNFFLKHMNINAFYLKLSTYNCCQTFTTLYTYFYFSRLAIPRFIWGEPVIMVSNFRPSVGEQVMHVLTLLW